MLISLQIWSYCCFWWWWWWFKILLLYLGVNGLGAEEEQPKSELIRLSWGLSRWQCHPYQLKSEKWTLKRKSFLIIVTLINIITILITVITAMWSPQGIKILIIIMIVLLLPWGSDQTHHHHHHPHPHHHHECPPLTVEERPNSEVKWRSPRSGVATSSASRRCSSGMKINLERDKSHLAIFSPSIATMCTISSQPPLKGGGSRKPQFFFLFKMTGILQKCY